MNSILFYQKGARVALTPDFHSSEFDCPCTHPSCGMTLVALDLVSKIQAIRNQIGPLKINSGFRCGPHNASLGGAPRSFHLIGLAADVAPLSAPLEELVECANREFATGGLGVYIGRVHVDLRPSKSRWIQVGKA